MEQEGPTMMYEDTDAAIMMANTSKPNGRTRHIDISYFAIQELVENGNIKLAHIQRVANPSNALTKALGWTLHQHHVTRMMGHTGCKHTCTSGKIIASTVVAETYGDHPTWPQYLEEANDTETRCSLIN
eukprot:7323968-Ditylum_brightwellii.AAC.1